MHAMKLMAAIIVGNAPRARTEEQCASSSVVSAAESTLGATSRQSTQLSLSSASSTAAST